MFRVVLFFVGACCLGLAPSGVGYFFGQASNAAAEDGSFISGFAPSTRAASLRFQIEKDFSLKQTYKKRDLDKLVQTAIRQANPRSIGLTPETSSRLSHQVVYTAQCYGIDPVVFTALIWRESNFKPKAVSSRGAVGLTQMTQTGIKEVLDRLSLRSKRRLPHLRALVKKCNPALYDRLPAEASADISAAWKNSVARSKSDALVMGALLLKINLASHRRVGEKSVKKIELYRSALIKYNGDPKIKEQFAKDVLMLSKRMTTLPEVALNDSRFLSQIRSF